MGSKSCNLALLKALQIQQLEFLGALISAIHENTKLVWMNQRPYEWVPHAALFCSKGHSSPKRGTKACMLLRKRTTRSQRSEIHGLCMLYKDMLQCKWPAQLVWWCTRCCFEMHYMDYHGLPTRHDLLNNWQLQIAISGRLSQSGSNSKPCHLFSQVKQSGRTLLYLFNIF